MAHINTNLKPLWALRTLRTLHRALVHLVYYHMRDPLRTDMEHSMVGGSDIITWMFTKTNGGLSRFEQSPEPALCLIKPTPCGPANVAGVLLLLG